MEQLKPPTTFSAVGDVAVNFEKWRKQFEIYFLASGIKDSTEISDERKVAIVRHCLGPEVQDIYDTLEIPSDDQKKWSKVLDHLGSHFKPKVNETINRHLFHTRKQREGESIDIFLTDLKKLSINCNFGNLKDSLIRDRVVCGIIDNRVRDSLLRESDLTLTKCINICKSAELANIHSQQLKSELMEVHGIKKGDNKQKEKSHKENYEKQVFCKACGRKHGWRCPAYKKQCRKCNEYNHFEKMCKNKRKVHAVTEEKSDESDEPGFDLFVNEIKYVSSITEWLQKIKVKQKGLDTEIVCKVDTGADVNILNMKVARELKVKIRPSSVKLRSYNGSHINVAGETTLKCEIKGIKEPLNFQIVDLQAPCIIGLPGIEKFKLIKKVQVLEEEVSLPGILEQNQNLFEGLGELKESYKIKLKEGVIPIAQPPRKIPIGLQGEVKKELDRMEKMQVIRKVTEPTEWCSALVIVKKPDGSLRLCLDPKQLNDAIVRERHQLPTFEDLAARMPEAKIISILDANKGFYQIKLEEESQLLTCFHAGSFGRYAYKRVPFGICSAPEVFHQKFKKVFEGLEGVEVYIDDILVWGINETDHNKKLKAVLERAKQNNVRFNKQKCHFGVTEVKYMGHVFSGEGLKPDNAKVRAILKMSIPKKKKIITNNVRYDYLC